MKSCGAKSFAEALRMCSEVFHVLKKVVPASGVGDEGGYAPNLDSDEDALKALVKAIELAGYKPYDDFMIAIDSACSEWFNAEDGCYHLPKRGIVMTREQMVDMYADFVEKYPIISLEDGMAEDDWEGWKMLMDRLGKKIQLVGDDLFVTNVQRIKKGIELGAANAVLIKLNQIGTLTETLDAIQHLTNYAVNRGSDKHMHISVDAESYRAKREESLVRLAEKMAAKAVKYKRSMALEPMNSYERHVIHTALQDYEGVTTSSTGTEPNRRVVVSYEKPQRPSNKPVSREWS